MALRVTCALCGRQVLIHDSYIVRMDVYAEPTTPPLDTNDEQNDPKAVLPELLKQIAKLSAEELQDQVHRRMEFRLCGRCQPGFLANPMGLPRERGPSRN